MKPVHKKKFSQTLPLPRKNPEGKASTSWEPVEKWYKETVGEEGHYYHQHVVIPGVLRLLSLDEHSSLLDLACGQGILGRQIQKETPYIGIDISPSLIEAAKQADKNPFHQYLIGDVLKPLPIKKKDFTHASIVLAIQNFEEPFLAIKNAAKHLIHQGRLVIAMNHPCFRVLRQSSWKVDEIQKIQYRRIDRYSSPMKIPIQAHPSKGKDSLTTLSFHHPLATYSLWLNQAGFTIELIEEWHSNKVSTGKAAKMENRSREEIPLFMAIKAIKNLS